MPIPARPITTRASTPMSDSVLTIGAAAFGLIAAGIGLKNWRYPVYGLLCFLPWAGIPTIALYPAPPMTRALKDVMFVLPAYASFAVWFLRFRPRTRIPAIILATVVAFALLVVLHAFDNTVANSEVALIGLRTWLFYMPLLALGYHLCTRADAVDRLARCLLLIALIPTAIGIAQSALIYGGARDLAFRMYGDAAHDVTQGFGRFEVGRGDLVRVASTFTFLSQYYNFVLAALCLAYGRWHAIGARAGWRQWIRVGPMSVIVAAGLLSGARGAFVTIPLFFLVVLALRSNWRGLLQLPLLLLALLTGAVALFGTTITDLYDLVSELATDYLTSVPIGELTQALGATWWGLGTGTNTGPARFVDPDTTRVVLENYFAKTIFELGLPGLLLISILLGAIVFHAIRITRRLKNPMLIGYADAIVGLLVLSCVNCWKASYLDLDPLNVYFWLLAGMLLRFPALDRPDPSSVATAPSPVRIGTGLVFTRRREPMWTT